MGNQQLNQVWKSIEPAVPDCLEQVEPNVYEARWWKPVPTFDVEVLRSAETVSVVGEPYEPQNLPSGIAVRFTLKP